jgi:sugar phosphate isomerase/epimerase
MKTNRRDFIKTGAAAAAGAFLLKDELLAMPAKEKGGVVALQLYSVRDAMMKDPVGTLKTLAAQGWVYVEHANYVNGKFYTHEPKAFRKVLDDLGLKMISGHTVFAPNHWDATKNDFTDSWKKLVDDAAVLGQSYVVSPWMDESMYKTYDEFLRSIEKLNKCGELCNKAGMKFGYHNHDFEFRVQFDGKKFFDIFMKECDPGKVVMQLDTGNLYNGGAIAMDVVKQYPGRWENLHVKDEIKSLSGGESYESTIVGEGIVNVKELLAAATKTGGVKVYVVEQESYQGKDPIECMKKNLDIMTSWGYKKA